MRYWIAEKIFNFWLWFGKRCYNCHGAGCGINWEGAPLECPDCNGSGFRKVNDERNQH